MSPEAFIGVYGLVMLFSCALVAWGWPLFLDWVDRVKDQKKRKAQIIKAHIPIDEWAKALDERANLRKRELVIWELEFIKAAGIKTKAEEQEFHRRLERLSRNPLYADLVLERGWVKTARSVPRDEMINAWGRQMEKVMLPNGGGR